MVKQNVALQNADGSHRCYLAPKEIDRLLKSRQVRRVVEKGKPVRYRMIAFPAPSNSSESSCEITVSEMQRLPMFGERELKRLARECNAAESKSEPRVVAKVKLIQRWLGHGLIERNAVTELIAGA